jgi:hypothetical protein
MESMLSTLAFALLIGAQFLATIVVISRRKEIYGELESPKEALHLPSEQIQRDAAEQDDLPAKAA